MLNIFATFQRSRTILDKFGNPIKSAITVGKNIDDKGFLAGMAAVAMEMAAVVSAAVMVTMTAAAGLAAGRQVSSGGAAAVLVVAAGPAEVARAAVIIITNRT